MGKKDKNDSEGQRRRDQIQEEMFGPKTPDKCYACGKRLPSSGRCICGY